MEKTDYILRDLQNQINNIDFMKNSMNSENKTNYLEGYLSALEFCRGQFESSLKFAKMISK